VVLGKARGRQTGTAGAFVRQRAARRLVHFQAVANRIRFGRLRRERNIPVTKVAERLKKALDVESVTKKFYREFQDQHIEFLKYIEGIDDERQRKWYASVLMNRLMFIYFLQGKRFIDNGDVKYLQNKLEESEKRGKDLYYKQFLQALFFEGFAKPHDKRSDEAKRLLGTIKYLNGACSSAPDRRTLPED
jgi:hypothetical protein